MARFTAAILGASTSGIENTASDRLIQLQVLFSGSECTYNRTTFYAESTLPIA